jgi:hypothetical protein
MTSVVLSVEGNDVWGRSRRRRKPKLPIGGYERGLLHIFYTSRSPAYTRQSLHPIIHPSIHSSPIETTTNG